eukprot:2401933-Alexandrium_andersonii.AAC.1
MMSDQLGQRAEQRRDRAAERGNLGSHGCDRGAGLPRRRLAAREACARAGLGVRQLGVRLLGLLLDGRLVGEREVRPVAQEPGLGRPRQLARGGKPCNSVVDAHEADQVAP